MHWHHACDTTTKCSLLTLRTEGPLPDIDEGLPGEVSSLGRRTLSRRAFLALASSAALSGILAACSTGSKNEETPVASGSATATLVRSTPGVETSPGTAETPTATVATAGSPTGSPAADRSVAMFLTLSSALTGFDGLNDQDLAKVYLANLGDEGNALVDLYAKIGLDSPDMALTFDQVQQAGVFDDDTLKKLADKITIDWYSGKYQQPNGDVTVATYVNALAWPATDYRLTGPSTCTGQTGIWASPPA